jgi:hypothetical protein
MRSVRAIISDFVPALLMQKLPNAFRIVSLDVHRASTAALRVGPKRFIAALHQFLAQQRSLPEDHISIIPMTHHGCSGASMTCHGT